MNGKVHLTAGIATGFAYVAMIGINDIKVPTLLTIVSASAIGALFPDIDIKYSKINTLLKKLLILTPLILILIAYSHYKITTKIVIVLAITVLIFKFSPHRSITHSLLGLIVTSYLLVFLKITDIKFIIYPFILGFISHIFLDMLTAEGVELLFPFRKHIKILNL